MKERFYIDTTGNDDEAYKEAMRFAGEYANKNKHIDRVILLALTKKNVGWLERIFKEATVRKMFNGIKIKGYRPLFKIETLRTYSEYSSQNDFVIAMAIRNDKLFKIDDYYNVSAILAIPWLKEDIEKWSKTWQPLEIRQNSKASSYPEPSCIVKLALEDLTLQVNLTTGITHPMDESLAKTYIRTLYKYEPKINGDIISSYLVSKLGWESDGAKDVKKLVDTLNEGRYFRGGNTKGLQNYYKIWKNKCK